MVLDTDGLGAGVDRLIELGHAVGEIRGGKVATEPEDFINAGSERYWDLRERFERGDIDMIPTMINSPSHRPVVPPRTEPHSGGARLAAGLAAVPVLPGAPGSCLAGIHQRAQLLALLFGLSERVSALSAIAALPIAEWEFWLASIGRQRFQALAHYS
jgi:hypothetical protein